MILSELSMRDYTDTAKTCQLSTRILGRALVLAAVLSSHAVDGRVQSTTRQPAVRLDPASVIIDAFKSHPVVALGEGPHGNEQGHAFRLARVRDPRFVSVVSDIVVESGSATYQDLMDRFIDGEEISESALREIRENTVTATTAWDRAIIDEFLYAVRDRNRSLSREKRLRILLGDPPIDWRAITSADEYRKVLLRRDSHPADLIRREVLAKGRRALVIYGDGHLAARSERPGQSMVGILETSGVKVFNLALLNGTLLGAAPLETLLGPLPPVDLFKSNPNIEDHDDAVLSLGPPSAMTVGQLSYPRCAEQAYVEMRVGRMVLTGMPAAVGDRLAQECAAAASRYHKE
jgi:hypothetical protein